MILPGQVAHFNIPFLCSSPTKVSQVMPSLARDSELRDREKSQLVVFPTNLTFSWDREILQPLSSSGSFFYEVLLSHLLVFAVSACVTCPFFKLPQETLLSFLCVLVLCIQSFSFFQECESFQFKHLDRLGNLQALLAIAYDGCFGFWI
ncbi:hypothetical protein I3843_Q063500 [Carya illinoinensis]|nr:hypothetical protein I3843_Q063500 [Carya illinoinensis]